MSSFSYLLDKLFNKVFLLWLNAILVISKNNFSSFGKYLLLSYKSIAITDESTLGDGINAVLGTF